MSTTPTTSIGANESDHGTTSSLELDYTSELFNYVATHVILPLDTPLKTDYTLEKDLALARAVCTAAHAYSTHVCGPSEAQWHCITRMLDNLEASLRFEHLEKDRVIAQLHGMQTGDTLTFLVRPHNSAVILTRRDNSTLFESFEVSPPEYAVEETEEPLVCSYPGFSAGIPNKMLDDAHFQFKLADSICRPSSVDSGPSSPSSTHAQYLAALRSGIMQGVYCTVDVPPIVKRVRDRVHCDMFDVSWRRSSLWLLIRVAIQMSLDRSSGRTSFKEFMLFFICIIAGDPNLAVLSTDFLHSIASKILRRWSKLRPSIPNWLSQIALKTCAGLRERLDARCKPLNNRSSPFRNPSQDELVRDTQLSLEHSREYICNVLAKHSYQPVDIPFHPSHRHRGTIDNFLSLDGAFFDEAYNADPEVTLSDIEQLIEHSIDDWIACVTDVEEACARLEILMDKYMGKADSRDSTTTEGKSILLLTGIELFVALDQLIVDKIPMLAEYSPEIPIVYLERLLLRRTTNLHRLSRAYQYLSARHSQSRLGWSVLSNAFTEDSFAIRYYNQSSHHRQLKSRIEQDVMGNCNGHPEGPRHPPTKNANSLSPLPALTLHAKVVVFELQCPASVRIWRSAVARIFHYFNDNTSISSDEEEGNLLSRTSSGLRRYCVDRDGPPLFVRFHFSMSQEGQTLRYAVQSTNKHFQDLKYLRIWPPTTLPHSLESLFWVKFRFLRRYVEATSHTSNEVLAAQAHCPTDFPLDEFIAFGHLRSGGSLQWTNILQGLRSRTLNPRRRQVYFLLTVAVSQVGPLDLSTGTWIWHRDLQEPSFCNALLDELESLCMDVRAGLIDGTMMNTISSLLTRVLASSPSETVSTRIIALLYSVRRKTFNWMQELSYNLAMAPTNGERGDLLLDMALTCRSTFDVDSVTLPKLFQSAEDVDAALSCALIIHALRSPGILDEHLRLFLQQDVRVSLALEGVLRDTILVDPSDYAIDLAVRKIFPSHEPDARRWEQMESLNVRWLTCRTKETVSQPSQIVHLNLLDGGLRVDGKSSGGLPHALRYHREYRQMFHDQGFFLIPSNLPGMDFTTLTATSKHKLHFSVRGDSVVIQAQSNESKDTLEVIPSTKLRGDLPPALVDGHVHWLNLSTRVIEIRPFERLWEQSPDNWRIDCTSGQYHVYKGREALVDMRSPTWAMVSKCFECLNFPERKYEHHKYIYKSRCNDLLVTTSPIDSLQSVPVLQLSVGLSRYGLSFFVNEGGELESRDFKGMVYDENQCVGAFPGLEHFLVLRPNTHLPVELIPRRVLVPNGFPERCYYSHCVRVQMDHESHDCYPEHIGADEPLYHSYNVDTDLGCLIGSGSLTNMQYLVQLHDMTSCDRPDPLTGKTGAQAAYFLLQSAACWSITQLKALDVRAGRTSTRYSQINALYADIRKRCYWNGDEYDYPGSKDLTTRTPAEFGASVLPCLELDERYNFDEKTTGPITLFQLFSDRQAPDLPQCNVLSHNSHRTSSEDAPKLDRLFISLPMNISSPTSTFKHKYVALLEKSVQRILEGPRMTHKLIDNDYIDSLTEYYLKCRVDYLTALGNLKERLGPTINPYQQALSQLGEWPPITADILLRCLASTSPIKLPGHWKKCLVSFALLLLQLQRARRLVNFALNGLEEEFSRELENEGCDGWNPEEYPDWLLIQIQGNLLIRRAQAEVAMEMISPKSGRNTVMQVNMGEGKSSVIIPIVAAALADRKQAVRVIVPKALTAQMFHLLAARLGGLANRPIYHFPFSRPPGNNVDFGLEIDYLHKLMLRCMGEGGILLVQPEHIVSLKLMSVEEQVRKSERVANPLSKAPRSLYERLTASLLFKSLPEDSFVGNVFRWLSRSAHHLSQNDIGWADDDDENSPDGQITSYGSFRLLTLQKWMDSHIRDILDESDEILHPRFQLLFTIGPEQHVDGYPDRWIIAQQVLRLVKECAPALSRNHPDSIEYRRGTPGSFPYIRCVRTSNVGLYLVSLITEDVMAGRLPSFRFEGISQELRDAIRSFISDKDVLQLPETVKRVEEYAKRSDHSCTWSGLLVLRGLLASNTLLFALTERVWRVDYGLLQHLQSSGRSRARTMLAVPYVAKDMPSPNAQFGHPDITIILTCLSYYYSGLSKEQLRSSFEILLDQDVPSTEYALWTRSYDNDSLPDSLRTLGEINLRSSEQWDHVIFPLFTRNQGAIDFYLSRVVFPKEAKEFPFKLSTSSWDLAEERDKVTTGFSGTNDGRWLLPMSIVQHDLDHQQGTSARILAYLLQPENDFYMAIHQNGKRETTHEFLAMVAMQKPEINILLDVGAQILDCSNIEVVKAWLDIVRDAAGAVYFDENDELMVLNRRGTSVLLLSSPLSEQLDRCVVYMDHVHTRGTDIKLPIGSRAAVTLGPKVTKDRLVQGCMRMRKLGHGHSVMFFAPPEVDLSIRTLISKQDSNTPVTTVDILCWAIHETWNDIDQRAPYWAQQGMDHKWRHDAWSRFCNNDLTSEQLCDAWLQPELKSLEDLYAPCRTNNSSASFQALAPGFQQRCKDLGVLSLPSAQMEEEQEREVNHEKECEWETELSPEAEPARHDLHPDVVALVRTGVIPSLHPGSAFRPIFITLEKSTAATCETDVWSPSILATADFCRTIKPESTKGTMDRYLRPVQWVLSRKRDSDEVLVLVSPFEADRLMPDIRASEYVHLHVYVPRTLQCMKPSDDLRLYSFPPLPSDWTPPWALVDQLNVFAGQLYLRNYRSYLRLCSFLGIPGEELSSDEAVRRNFFNIPGSLEENEIAFSNSPLPSVMALLAIRNRGRPFTHTHMGKILLGQPLRERDFEVPRSVCASGVVYAACDNERPNTFASETAPASPMGEKRDLQDSPEPSASLPSAKRGLEMAEISDANSKSSRKRLRLD